MDGQGNVWDQFGNVVGREWDAQVYARNGERVGSALAGGGVFYPGGRYVGHTYEDGRIFVYSESDESYTLVGRVSTTGDVFDKDGHRVGSVKTDAPGAVPGTRELLARYRAGGAALLLLLNR